MIGTESQKQAAAHQRQEIKDFFLGATPLLEQEAHRRHRGEAAVRAKLERDQRDYLRHLDAELDAEAALLAQQDHEAAEEAAETDVHKIIARQEARRHEHEQIERKVREAVDGKTTLEKIPSGWGIYRQDLAARRKERAEKAHAEAEAKAGIPRRRKSWEERRDKILAEAEKAITDEDKRHADTRQAINAKREKELEVLGEMPTLSKPPIRVPAVRLSDHRETVTSLGHVNESGRELTRVGAPGSAPAREKATHPEIAKAKAMAARVKARVR